MRCRRRKVFYRNVKLSASDWLDPRKIQNEAGIQVEI